MSFNKVMIPVIAASMICLPQVLLAKDAHSQHESRFNHRYQGHYAAGDFHNYSTFSDGSVAIQWLEYESRETWGLDWFAQSGHGGQFRRDGRMDDFNYDCNADGQGDVLANTVGTDKFEGDPTSTGYCDATNMWRWQSLEQPAYPKTIEKYNQFCKPIWQAFKYEVPGHEHCSTGNIAGQFKHHNGNVKALAQFEYLFDYEAMTPVEAPVKGGRESLPTSMTALALVRKCIKKLWPL
jgi:hypothetical protein